VQARLLDDTRSLRIRHPSRGFGRFSIVGQLFSIPRPPVEATPAGDSCESGARNRVLSDHCGGVVLVRFLGATNSRPLTRIRAGQVSRRTRGDAAKTWAALSPFSLLEILVGQDFPPRCCKKQVFLDTPGDAAETCMSLNNRVLLDTPGGAAETWAALPPRYLATHPCGPRHFRGRRGG
jgi:hypothetical protein